MGGFLFHFILSKIVVRYPRNIVCVSRVHFLNNLESSDPLPRFSSFFFFVTSIVFMGGSLGLPLQIGRNSPKVIDIVEI